MRIRPAAITLALLALVAGLAAAALMPSSAAASTKPCWEQVIDDWLDNGTIDGHYKASCYQQALKRVPEDLRDYSNITDAISAALSASLRGDGTGHHGRRQRDGRRLRLRQQRPERRPPAQDPGRPSSVDLQPGDQPPRHDQGQLDPDPAARPRRPRRAAPPQRRRPRSEQAHQGPPPSTSSIAASRGIRNQAAGGSPSSSS